MTELNRTFHTWWLILAVLVSTMSLGSYRRIEKKSVLASSVDKDTVVRFFYNPPGDYFHFPLIFRPVATDDPRLNTAPMGAEGRTAYISLVEMRQLLQGLMHSDLSWQESEKIEPLESFKKLTPWADNMEILLVSSKGTARTNLNSKKICETLKPLDAALTTPRALWEFQGFRLNYGCKVPGFIYGAYPDHL